eukprot:CAMPEP_0170984818 /NCGR_PEP_ID=MMETSP0736-20130129/5099_1 /TAXON_ID=186038 /ORGANISM="Fragilariopsis kerguelensis, Strain L26-C5" /LENGTH=281 /DNA_ID=CAMNT_0011408607 /DNA_START=117 /DNA_END=962 /DNA_ORIENTATION=+
MKMNQHYLRVATVVLTAWALTKTVAATAAVAAAVSSTKTVVDTTHWNVYGKPLESCSEEGMALTGFTRSGSCVELDEDVGSHHICIDMSSLDGMNPAQTDPSQSQDFCQVTGQPDWCASQDMACHEDSNKSDCPVVDWCVCQWAFSEYVNAAGGCDKIQQLKCESTNIEAVLAYNKVHSTRPDIQTALECLVAKCDLDIDNLPTTKPTTDTDTSSTAKTAFLAIENEVDASSSSWSMFPFAIVIAGVALLTYQRYTHHHDYEHVGLGGISARGVDAGSYLL